MTMNTIKKDRVQRAINSIADGMYTATEFGKTLNDWKWKDEAGYKSFEHAIAVRLEVCTLEAPLSSSKLRAMKVEVREGKQVTLGAIVKGCQRAMLDAKGGKKNTKGQFDKDKMINRLKNLELAIKGADLLGDGIAEVEMLLERLKSAQRKAKDKGSQKASGDQPTPITNNKKVA